MLTISIVIALAMGLILWIARTRGLESALPVAAFFFVLLPRDAGIPTGIFDLTAQRLILATLLVLYLVLPKTRQHSRMVRLPLAGLIALHISWCMLSTLNSIVPVESIKKLIGELFEYYVLYYIFFRTIKDTRTIHRIISAIVAAVTVACIFGAVEEYRGWSVMELFPASAHHFVNWSTTGALSGRDDRVTSTFAHPILFGAGLALAIPLTLYLLKAARTKSQKVLLWGSLFLMLLNIYKTSSRGPWLGLLLALGLLLLLDSGRMRRYLAVIGILTLAVLLLRPGIWDTLLDMYYATSNPDSPLGSSYSYRYALRRVAMKALNQSPERALLGYGMESFYSLHLSGELEGRIYPFLSCDSAWVETAMETGYVGIAILAALLFRPAWRCWRDFRRFPKGDRDICLCLFVDMIAYYFMMLSVAMYGWGQTGYMLWMMIAMSQSYSLLKRAPQKKSGTPDRLRAVEDVPEPVDVCSSLHRDGQRGWWVGSCRSARHVLISAPAPR
jgi:hypothetical protein